MHLWAYDEQIGDFRLFASQQEWEAHITVHGAARYLREHLQESLRNDFYPAHEAYERIGGVGFFALPRIIFPYITFLGTLLKGTDNAVNAISYMEKYFPKVNQTYGEKGLCAFIYKVYRHGLTHTNMPKVVNDSGKIYGWTLTFIDADHLKVAREGIPRGKAANLYINPKKVADEVVSSIDEYIKDLYLEEDSLINFRKGFISMAETLHGAKIVVPDYIKQL
ncbi:MAG: hypothetical protein HY687_03470 [Chloroflexi bacterium]|nr:hypothetical protein [Chloroflexota bacterium]